MTKKHDIVIIGSGIAGSMFAYKVSKSCPDLDILILEAGNDRSSERTAMSLSFAASIVKSPISAYDKNPDVKLASPASTHDYYDKTSDDFKSTYLRMGGGTTWHWLGNTPRHLPNDFRLKSAYGVGLDWPIGYDDLEPFYAEAEKEMGVSGNHEEWNGLFPGAFRSADFPMPMIWPSYLEKVIKQGLEGSKVEGKVINIRSTPQARNSQAYEGRPPCAGNSSCVPICPIGAKYDAMVHVNKALGQGVKIRYEAAVQKIEADASGKISRIHYIDWSGRTGVVEGRIVILAANAIESSILLLFNGLANGSGLVGRNLMDHPQGYGVGIYKEPIYTFRGPPTTSGIDAFRDGEFRKDSAAFRISIGNDGWGRFARKDNPKKLDNLEFLIEQKFGTKNFVFGKALREAVADNVTRIFRFSYSTEMLPHPDNRIRLSEKEMDPVTKLPRPRIEFVIDREGAYNKNAFKMAGKVLTGLFTKLGVATEDFEVQDDQKIFSGAGHIMGTLPMGRHAKTSVVDKDLRSHDHDNLFIVGSGAFPTSCTANPTLTVAALSLRLAEHIVKLIKGRKI